MRLYLELAKRSFQQTLTYRGAVLAGIFTNSVFGVMIAGVYLALFRSTVGSGEEVAGFTEDQAMTWVWINQALIAPVYIWGWWEVVHSIQSGAIVSDLMKPFDYFTMWLSRDIGRGAAHFLLRGVPTFLVGMLLYRIDVPESGAVAAFFLVSVALSVVTSFCLRFFWNVLGFWVNDFRGLAMMYAAIINLFSGFLIPLAFFPSTLRMISDWLPFRAVMMVPSELYLGHRAALSGLAIQLLWIAILVVACRWILRIGERKLVVHGG